METARTGNEALAMARVGAYDAVLIDIRLPDLNGYDAFRQLSAAQAQARMVLMTSFGYDAGHSIVKARQEGLRFVLYKPFRIDQLIDALSGRRPPFPVRAFNRGFSVLESPKYRKGCPGWEWSSLCCWSQSPGSGMHFFSRWG